MKTIRKIATIYLLIGATCYLCGGCAATSELIRTDALAVKTVRVTQSADSIRVFDAIGGSNVVVHLRLDSRRVPGPFQLSTNDIVLSEVPKRGASIRPDPHTAPRNMFVYIQDDLAMWSLGYANGHSYHLGEVQESDRSSLLLPAEPSFSTNSLPCLFEYQTPKNAVVVGAEKTLLFPFAAAFDIVTSPYQLWMMLVWGKD